MQWQPGNKSLPGRQKSINIRMPKPSYNTSKISQNNYGCMWMASTNAKKKSVKKNPLNTAAYVSNKNTNTEYASYGVHPKQNQIQSLQNHWELHELRALSCNSYKIKCPVQRYNLSDMRVYKGKPVFIHKKCKCSINSHSRGCYISCCHHWLHAKTITDLQNLTLLREILLLVTEQTHLQFHISDASLIVK